MGRADQTLKRTVVKLSGSLFRYGARASSLKPYAELFPSLLREGIQSFVVTGGGPVARSYISIGRDLEANESTLDEIGIAASRINAMLLAAGMKGSAFPSVPTTLDEVSRAGESEKVVVCGGLHPGQSTNAVAALIAERVGASMLVNATDVDAVYTKDPHRFKDAAKLGEVSISRLEKILDLGARAGAYELMDHVALRIVERSDLKVRLVKCSAENIRSAIEGKKVGTLILPERGVE